MSTGTAYVFNVDGTQVSCNVKRMDTDKMSQAVHLTKRTKSYSDRSEWENEGRDTLM
jgi:hypothetical protein